MPSAQSSLPDALPAFNSHLLLIDLLDYFRYASTTTFFYLFFNPDHKKRHSDYHSQEFALIILFFCSQLVCTPGERLARSLVEPQP